MTDVTEPMSECVGCNEIDETVAPRPIPDACAGDGRGFIELCDDCERKR